MRVGLRAGSSSTAKAEAAGLQVVSTADAAREADVVMMLLPDTEIGPVYDAEVAPNLAEGDALFFAHGFNVRFGYVKAPNRTLKPWAKNNASPSDRLGATSLS